MHLLRATAAQRSANPEMAPNHRARAQGHPLPHVLVAVRSLQQRLRDEVRPNGRRCVREHDLAHAKPESRRGQNGNAGLPTAASDVTPPTMTASAAFASNVLDAGGTLDEAQDLLGHASISSKKVYAHPDLARLRAAVDAVPSPRDLAGAKA
jgi:hypothetical protein